MATKGKTWSKARAVCPRPEHAGSRVRFDGLYGKLGHRRQRYRCLPANGDRSHRFTEPLPREEAWHDDLRALRASRGLARGTARGPQLPVRGARDCRGVGRRSGAGVSYRQAALVARERARRLPGRSGDRRAAPDAARPAGGDWVEVFAPVVFEPHRPSAWPRTGSLLLDDVPFPVRDPARPAAFGSPSGSSARRALRRAAQALAPGGVHEQVAGRLGARSWARWAAPRRGSSATTTRASPAPSRPASRRPSSISASGTCATRWSG